MPPSDSTPPTNTDKASLSDTQASPEEDAQVFDAFGEWNTIPDHLSLYSRVLISEIAVAFAQSASQDKIEKYAADLKPEMRRALCDRAQRVVDKYTSDVTSSLKQDAAASMWIDAVKWGIASNLDDFKASLDESFTDLSEFVRGRTSYQAQAVVALIAALFLSIFVLIARNLVTVFDDVRPNQSTTQAAGTPQK